MKRVLIVDDKEENLYYLQALLAGHGWEADTARHGAEALVKARQQPPDLIISDLLMPIMDGYTLLRHWKTDANLKQIPFVVYTATYTEPEDERLALSLGADAFVLKPAEPEDFLSRLRELQTRVVESHSPVPNEPVGEEKELLKVYSETLIRKLEEKSLQLEDTNRALEQDIRERKQVEEQLRESEERFRELAETIQEAFWITDPSKTRMLYISPAYEKIWGRTCASLFESPRDWLEAVHPDDRERVEHAVTIKQPRGDYDETYRIQRPDGSVRWIHDRAFPVQNAAGEVVRLVGTAEDITRRRQLEEQFHQAQKMEAIGELAAGVAHDFNNILAVILGNSQLALADMDEGHPACGSLEQIKKATLRAASLVQQILAFSRQQPQERRVIELGPALQESIMFLRATIPSVIELVISVDAATPPVLADPTQIHQVIVNLCTNAWHALDDQPGRIEVKLQALTLDTLTANQLAGLKPGRVACLSVTDNGKGMAAAILERIFNPFFTTKGLGKGTGLGLSVVHGIVQSHDGAISVTSQPGKGTTFNVYLPAATAPVDDAAARARVLHRGNGQHILYLDDEESLVFLAERILEPLGYRVSGFTRAAEAQKRFNENPDEFDLVITDLNMPGASGLKVAADLLKVRPDVPVMLCSGHVTEDLRQRALRIGIREVLYKPNTMEEFSEAVHRLASKIPPG
ncbi:MAG: response regulator [Akkermansiaceae bacterium]|nr:response regulator [Verrucomicrobiales bacterium]